MKNILLMLLSAGVLTMTACSRSDKVDTTAKPQSTPDAERLKSDSERLQQATSNAAKQRERQQASRPQESTSPGPKADLSPHTVPPQSPNPNP
jgi:Na+-transporting methylmalonyl-CoA/oxaloacetate decarboxylase gamma subunit